MRVAGLFAGIGGLELGLRNAGHEAELFAENWSPAAAVLAARFEHVPNVGDVAGLRALPRGVELLAAGFPCQDLSQAGRTAGISGSRSGLVDHVFRLLDRRRAPWVLLENVSFMLHLDGGRAMARLVAAFEERGYRWAYRVVNSLSFTPQRRERVFFVASREGRPEDVLFADEAMPPERVFALDTHAHGFYWTEGVRGLGWAPDSVPTLKNGSTLGIASPPAILFPDGMIGKPDIRDAERLQGFPENWTKPAEAVCRSSWRWSLVGNAVTVPVAEWVGGRLATPGRHDEARDRPMPVSGRWPKAARFDGRRTHEVEISAFPVWRRRRSLAAFLRHPVEPLSVRATAGFLGRTDRSALRFVPGFRDRVAAHLARMEAREAMLDGRIAAE
ncbi:MAG: DNA (cytosine-5-)-methyltransferase [Methylobacteriaceae bacterium]|nr:DNA (cytosine-5-)-methyltransferase [Methylobacteriaceae bacterium]